MTRRTIVTVEPAFGGGACIKLDKAPAVFQDARVPRLIDCRPETMPALLGNGAVRDYGQRINAALCSHPAIRGAIEAATRAPVGDSHAIYFALETGEAERLLWEVICDEQGRFLALDNRWPIARMADPLDDQPPATRMFELPVRVLALLSARRVDARRQWEALRLAVEEARNRGLETKLHVLVGQEDLLGAIRTTIREGLEDVEVAPLPDRRSEIADAIDATAPHILHFFCHGSAAVGVPQLELATIVDWDGDNSSIRLTLDDLAGIEAMRNVWLVTLNCCEGGRATDDIHSLAHGLVSRCVPAVVGMLEPIEAADADEFSGAFYRSVFRILRDARSQLRAEDPSVVVVWAQALHAARTAMVDRRAPASEADDHRWAIPVLYVRRERFELNLPRPAVDDADGFVTSRARGIAGALRAIPPGSPDEFRQRLLDTLQDAPERLRPDHFGSFAGSDD